jgi:catechol 2,3-dioxygenase-like lactoylglutathione lyase family enzyme
MIFARDVMRAVAWYKDKLGFTENFASPYYASLRHETMGCRLDIHPSEAEGRDVGHGPMPYFVAREFDAALKALRAKGVKTGEPRREGESPFFVTFWDSEGNALGLEGVRGG